MGLKIKILNLLEKKDLTAKQISVELRTDLGCTRVYIWRLKKQRLIESYKTIEGKELIYKIKKTSSEKSPEIKEMVIFLNNFFKNNVKYLAKNKEIYDFIIQNELKFKLIEKLISNE